MTASELFTLLSACFKAQNEATRLWHQESDPAFTVSEPPTNASAAPETLRDLMLAQHWRNFQLWHVEDIARRRDVTTAVIAECKQRIDRLNQERNDRMERVDACLVALLEPLLPPSSADTINTESLGMAIDRLSILSLKIWHMEEQLDRSDVTSEHLETCRRKSEVLNIQRRDLMTAILHLVQEYLDGLKKPRLYFQFKMYNDPTLNPELYGKRA